MNTSTGAAWRKGGVGHSLAHVNALSFCSQAVQLGAVPALIALRLNASGFSVTVLGIVAAAPWLAVLLLGQRVPKLLLRHNYVPVNVAALTVTAAAVLVIIVAHHPLLIFAANFCLGVGLILRWVTCDSWIIALAPDAIRGRAIGVHETLMGCGIAAGPLIIALFGSRTAAPLFACLGLLFLATYALFRVGASQPADVPADASNAKSLRYIGLMALAAFSAGFIETSSVSFLPVLSLHAHWPVVSTLALGVFTLGGDAAAASDRIYGGRSGVSTRPADHRGIDRGLKCGVRADGPSARATAHNLVCDGRRCRSDEYARGHRGRIIGCREPDCRGRIAHCSGLYGRQHHRSADRGNPGGDGRTGVISLCVRDNRPRILRGRVWLELSPRA